MAGNGFRLEQSGALWVVRSELLLGIPDLGHAFSTRRGAGGELDAPRVLAAAGLDGAPLARIRQCHGARVVDAPDALAEAQDADAVVTARGAPVAAVRTADCVPLLLADRGGRAAAVHAGWRGIVAGVVASALERMIEEGTAPRAVVAAVGPCIGPCCYEVGPEVASAVERASLSAGPPPPPRRGPGGGVLLDLRQAVRNQLEAAGVLPGAIREAPWCTACAAEWFHSFRRDAQAAGRQIACIGWRACNSGGAP